jgi:hypothetical protein
VSVRSIFQAHRTTQLWHYTRLANLESIIEFGAICCRAELERRGIAFESEHYYGTDEKRQILGEYVSCAHMPAWGMMQDEQEELVVMSLDLAAAEADGTCFCPGYAALGEYDANEIITWTTDQHLERLYTGLQATTTVRGAEIFVPDRISADHIQRICFFASASRDAQRPILIEAARRSQHVYRHKIDLAVEPGRFPRQWAFGAPWEEETEEIDE